MKNINIILLCLLAAQLLFLTSCKKYHLKKLQHRWQFIEMPVDTSVEVWSFETDGRLYLINLHATTEDTAVIGNYEVLWGNKVAISGYAASYNATWDITKNNEEVMILTTKDLGGVTTREFLNLEGAN